MLVAGAGGPGSTPKAYPPVECVFPPGETFKHYDLKWRDYRAAAVAAGDRRRTRAAS